MLILDGDRLKFRCGHSVRVANLQASVLDHLLPDRETRQHLYEAFRDTTKVQRVEVTRALKTARHIAQDRTNDPVTAFCFWLMAVSEKMDPAVELETIAARLTTGEIAVSDFLLQEES